MLYLIHGENIKPESTPSRDGYNFVGWSTTTKKSGIVDFNHATVTKSTTYTNKSGGKKVTYVTDNVTVYAQWTKGYTITLNANGGRFSNDLYITQKTITVPKKAVLGEYYPYTSDYQPLSTSNSKGFVG